MTLTLVLFEGEILGFIQANLQKLSLLIGLEPLQDFGPHFQRDRVDYGMLGGEGGEGDGW